MTEISIATQNFNMHSLTSWLRQGILLFVGVVLSLGLCSAAWNPGGPANRIAALPPGNAIKDPQVLLRRALPIDNEPIRQIQAYVDGTSEQLRGKRWAEISSSLSKALKVYSNSKPQLLSTVPESKQEEASALIGRIGEELTTVKALADQKDRTGFLEARTTLGETIGELEADMVRQFPFEVPAEYDNLPQLKGRATVVLETTQGPIKVVVDGYSAPVTAGNFVDLVKRGFYDGLEFTRAEEAYVLQIGDPPGPDAGFIDPKTGDYRAIPFEVLIEGDSEPIYGTTLEEAGLYKERPVLPFSAYGTLALARPSDDPNGGSSQFFFLLFDSELTPAGINLLDGRYAVFGYAVEGQEVLGELQAGDKIKSAKVTQGLENLV